MDTGTIFFILAIIIVGIFVYFAIILTSRRMHHFDVEEYQTDFLKIENTLDKNNKLSYAAVVSNADKLLDKALIEAGFMGKSMGERLKKSGNRFSELNSVWNAHKLRNRIAHETDFEVSYVQARNALEIYKKALKDLGAI